MDKSMDLTIDDGQTDIQIDDGWTDRCTISDGRVDGQTDAQTRPGVFLV